ncbi:MAG: BMP family ABC transporter substrate-binding protein [Rhodospirillaceae bacterium]|nr:BMP family ABC transporter substrate-binding protein [Rhodospirillaceae bacterium]MBT6138299.1 BMP family ABC transporter substrate-binding protein [Rhodospirillaceae bacterium]
MGAALAALVAGTAGVAEAETKVGFIYVGPIGDHGWSYRHDQGRLAIEKALGSKVKTTYVESVKEGPDAERVIRQLAASGHDLIFTTSFGFMNPTLKVAKKFPKIRFEHATGYKQSKNLSTYSGRFYEGRYIIGTIAGKMSKTNKIGYVASFPIPEVVRGINAFILGARSVNPKMKINVVWVNSWYDPGKEGDAAKALIDQGADIITQHTDSPAPLQVAENRGVHGFGQASDMIKFAPKAQLTAIVDNWDKYYIDRTKAVIDGSWKKMDTWGGLDAKMVSMAPYTNMPADVAKLAAEVQEKIRSGKLHPFAGPIRDQSGKEILAAGKTFDDKTLLGMNFYVEGVEGSLPK